MSNIKVVVSGPKNFSIPVPSSQSIRLNKSVTVEVNSSELDGGTFDDVATGVVADGGEF